MKRTSFAGITIAGVVLTLLAVAVAARRSPAANSGGDDVPVGEVKRGDLAMTVHGTGELSASHTVMLTAPAVGGGALRIARLTVGREPVKKDDIVIEFDPSEQHYKLEQSRSELLQAQQEIIKAKADALVLAAQDKVALLKARYAVRKAELDVQKKEIASAIDGAKYEAALTQAKQSLEDLQANIESHAATGQASIYLAQEKCNKTKLAMDQAQQNIDKMRVTAPMNGLISVQKNTDASGGFFFTGMSLPDYRAGDQAQAGSVIAQIVDPSDIELTAKIGERERSNIKVGQSVDAIFDALPGRTYHGSVKSVGGMSSHQFFDDNAAGMFSVSIKLAEPDTRLRSGMTANLLLRGDTQKNVLYIPRQAVFLKDGKSMVYVQASSGYQQREVTRLGETESQAIVAGKDGELAVGSHVALIDPTAPRKQQLSGSSSDPVGGNL